MKDGSMKRTILLLTAVVRGLVRGRGIGADAQDGEGSRRAPVRRQSGRRRILQSRRQGQLDRLRRRFLPRDRGCGPQRSDQGEVHAAVRQGSVRAAQDRRDRRAVAQYHLDAVARRLVRQFRGDHLLRRPGLHGAQGAQGQFGARAQRRLGLHADRHHDRAQSRRLLPLQQHEVRGDRVRHRGRDGEGLRGGTLRRVHHRRVAALCGEAQARQRQRPRDPARDHLQGAARAAGAPRRRPVVRHRQMDALRRCSTPRSSACRPRTSTRR